MNHPLKQLLEQADAICSQDSDTQYVLSKIKKQFADYVSLSEKTLNAEDQAQLREELSNVTVQNEKGFTQNIWFEKLDTLTSQKNKLIETKNALEAYRNQVIKGAGSRAGSVRGMTPPGPEQLQQINTALSQIESSLSHWNVSEKDLAHLLRQKEQLEIWRDNPPDAQDTFFTQKFNQKSAIEKLRNRTYHLTFLNVQSFCAFRGIPSVEHMKARAEEDKAMLSHVLSLSDKLYKDFSSSQYTLDELEAKLNAQINDLEMQLPAFTQAFKEFKKMGDSFAVAVATRQKTVKDLKKLQESKELTTRTGLFDKIKKITYFLGASNAKPEDHELANLKIRYEIENNFSHMKALLASKRKEFKEKEIDAQREIKEAKNVLNMVMPKKDTQAEMNVIENAFSDEKKEMKDWKNKLTYYVQLSRKVDAIENDTLFARMLNQVEQATLNIKTIPADFIKSDERADLLNQLQLRQSEIIKNKKHHDEQVNEHLYILVNAKYEIEERLVVEVNPALEELQKELNQFTDDCKKLKEEVDSETLKKFDINLIAISEKQKQVETFKKQQDLMNRFSERRRKEIKDMLALIKEKPHSIFDTHRILLQDMLQQLDNIKKLAPVDSLLEEHLADLAKKKTALSSPGVSAEKKVDISAVRSLLERLEISLASPEFSDDRLQMANYPALMKEKLQSDQSTMEKMVSILAPSAAPSELQERAQRVLAEINSKLLILNKRAVEIKIPTANSSRSIFFHPRRK